jgi:saccharopine dehydrogenase-like NADP-dependent oxidoreductase
MVDLARDPEVEEILCADLNFDALEQIRPITDMTRIRTIPMDCSTLESLTSLFGQADIVIDLLPKQFLELACEAAIASGKNLVNTNYGHGIRALDARAKKAGIAILPEVGLDPGIDLVIYKAAREYFDTLTVINSYCGGFPEKSACTNPINYKLSWIWAGVLSSLTRHGRIIRNGSVVDVPGSEIHDPGHLHSVEFPGIGTLEAIINGDAVSFVELLGLGGTILESGRYTLRWPGWSDFWRPLKQLGFLEETPVPGLPCPVTPVQFLDRHMGPRLAYQPHEKDLVAMLNVFEGVKDGRRQRMTSRVMIERDLETGLMGMSMGVGYPVVIAAKMVARGEIPRKGVLSPTEDMPVGLFKERLEKRGIVLQERVENLD